MKIEKIIPKKKFDLLSKRYISRTDLPLFLADLKGDIVYKASLCELCKKQLGGENKILIRNCRFTMIRAIKEAYRWGEGYITTCPAGLIMFAVPIVFNKKLIGGFLSGFAIFPEMKTDIKEEIYGNLRKYCDPGKDISMNRLKLRTFSLEEVREHVSYLFILTRNYRINDITFLKEVNEKYVQQYKIANFLEELKKNTQDVGRKIFDEQDEIIQKVKLGDKTGAREILNEFLGTIFFESGMNFEVLKVRIIELVVIISRAAIETGVEAKELMGLNYSYLTELNKVTDIEELLYKLTEILENFISKVSLIKEKKKKIKIDKMCEYVNQNFTKRITAKEVARIGGLSVSRALHLFREETGLSLSQYIRKLRIDYGKYLLLNTDVSLADSAIEAGFFDQSHFTKTFKRVEKMTPSRFREKYRRYTVQTSP
ncbi:MAG: helix-turn-helix domain-containing protein [Candidatus Aminicenantes bacterium]|nr:MAG: helix-turn-helix domain-containing protein [Candidatus Aminicenantes bacterium]